MSYSFIYSNYIMLQQLTCNTLKVKRKHFLHKMALLWGHMCYTIKYLLKSIFANSVSNEEIHSLVTVFFRNQLNVI